MNTGVYILFTWPDYQQYMEEDWWDECVVSELRGQSVCFVPEHRIEKTNS